MKAMYILLLSLFFSNYVWGDSSTGKIKNLTIYLNNHTTQSARGFIDFEVLAALSPPCSKLYFNSQEVATTSLIIAAKAKDIELRFYYSPDKTAPWNSSICEIYAVREP
ncbi:hypothetical protein QE250_01755 [Chromatiaceae bacterium AAb-1]|nr:hypothetical protein [Chromatiaceae bacterium AAb-1]